MLTIKDLHVAYGEIQVVWGVSFDVPGGEIVAMIGPNGAGKSTTLKAILGLLPVLAGSVTFKGQDISKTPTHDIVQSGLVLVPEAHATFTKLNVIDNLTLGAFNEHARPHKDETLEEVFEIFPRLKERQTQIAGTLSGGERQMLAIGKALMARPDMLILDEPSLGLAPLIVERIFKVIQSINQRGMSILLVEQNVQMSLEIASQAYIIELGKIIDHGSSEELLHSPSVQDAYLSL